MPVTCLIHARRARVTRLAHTSHQIQARLLAVELEGCEPQRPMVGPNETRGALVEQVEAAVGRGGRAPW